MIKRMIAAALAALTAVSAGLMITANAAEDFRFSDEYKGSPYYTRLMTALDENKDKSTMEKTLAVSLSQEDYKNYATSGIDIEKAKSDGLLWTGAELRMNSADTGNTEYTRWAQRYIMDRDESTQYLDCDWCAIYVSWCMYQAGYYDKEELKRCYYSYYANPTRSYDADGWILTYNLDQHDVWYTATAEKKLGEYNWNTYYNTNVDPMEIDYKPGGLVFFSWDGTGEAFDHVAIVVDYDKDTHVLTYTNGNSDGQVITREIDLDTEEQFRGMPLAKNSSRIAAYGEYDEIKPLEQKVITTDQAEIEWDKSATTGIKIQTDSESKVCSVNIDGNYLGSTIESNMVLIEGRMAIGKSEMKKISAGTHTLTLIFEDGELNLPLKITDGTEDLTPTTEPVTTEPVTTKPVTVTQPVTASAAQPAAVKSPKLVESISLGAGKVRTLKVTDGVVKRWKSSDKSVATVKNGKVTALKKGTALITATLADDSGLTCKLTVTSNPSIKIKGKKLNAKKTYTVNKGKSLTLKLIGKASAVNNVYKTSKKSVAKITSKKNSKTVKIKGLKPGSARITVKVNGVSFRIKVKVK